jgi:magnesium transporter
MKRDVIRSTTTTDQEEVARLMTRYNLAAVPVVDEEGVLKGVVTYEDVLDVLVKEATEDLYRLANVTDTDLTVNSPVFVSVRRRLPWLVINLLTALFASWVISNFESTIARVAILAAFQSVVAGMGGNAATQTLAIMVRTIALGQVQLRQSGGALFREFATGLINGISVGVVAGLGLYVWKGNPWLGLILGLAIIGNLVVAGLAGAFVPLALKAVRLDPALASSVIVTTFTDSLGFALFLGLATAFLPKLA